MTALDGGEWSTSRFIHFTRLEEALWTPSAGLGGCREEKSLALVGNGIQDRPFYCLVNIPAPYTHDIKLKFLVLQMFTAAPLETAKIATIFQVAGLIIVIPPLLRVAFKGKCFLLLHP